MPKFQQIVSGYDHKCLPVSYRSKVASRHAEKSIRQDCKKEIARQLGDPSLNRRKHAPRHKLSKLARAMLDWCSLDGTGYHVGSINIRFRATNPDCMPNGIQGKYVVLRGNRRTIAANAILTESL